MSRIDYCNSLPAGAALFSHCSAHKNVRHVWSLNLACRVHLTLFLPVHFSCTSGSGPKKFDVSYSLGFNGNCVGCLTIIVQSGIASRPRPVLVAYCSWALPCPPQISSSSEWLRSSVQTADERPIFSGFRSASIARVASYDWVWLGLLVGRFQSEGGFWIADDATERRQWWSSSGELRLLRTMWLKRRKLLSVMMWERGWQPEIYRTSVLVVYVRSTWNVAYNRLSQCRTRRYTVETRGLANVRFIVHTLIR